MGWRDKKALGASPRARENSRNYTILLVEDEFFIRMSMAEELRSAGFTVVEATNADEAISVIQGGASIDVLFTDVKMPGSMDGIALAHRVQADFPAIKILVTSANDVPSEQRKGINGFLRKPYRVATLIRRIERMTE